MTAGYPSNDPSSEPSTAREVESDAAEKTESQQLLDQVLQETLQITSADESLSSDEMRALLALARRRESEPFGVETVTELVQTVLRLRFRRLVASSSLWDKMTRRITETMIDDPRMNERMNQFWTRLCEAAK